MVILIASERIGALGQEGFDGLGADKLGSLVGQESIVAVDERKKLACGGLGLFAMGHVAL